MQIPSRHRVKRNQSIVFIRHPSHWIQHGCKCKTKLAYRCEMVRKTFLYRVCLTSQTYQTDAGRIRAATFIRQETGLLWLRGCKKLRKLNWLTAFNQLNSVNFGFNRFNLFNITQIEASFQPRQPLPTNPNPAIQRNIMASTFLT